MTITTTVTRPTTVTTFSVFV